MSRRKTVKINLQIINPLIKSTFRSYIVFCEKMGRAHNWVTDWNRRDKDGNPAPKNLPSPEEAARMCVLLQTTPEEILVEEADIELVRSLIEREREKGIKKERPADGEARVCDLPESIQKIINICLDRPELASALLTLAQQIEKG